MVYLLHFDRAYRHARHYTGFAKNAQTFARRIEHHKAGTGSRLMAAVSAAGIGFVVAETWDEGDRNDERRLKNRGGARRYCPICRRRHAA